MAIGGLYAINGVSFPVPITSWEQSIIGAGLNGLPKNCSYRVHTWTWPGGSFEACDMKSLIALFEQQNEDGVQLTSLSTDPHDAYESTEKFGTVTYTDFTWLELTPVQRGLPHYENVQCKFEVYTASHS